MVHTELHACKQVSRHHWLPTGASHGENTGVLDLLGGLPSYAEAAVRKWGGHTCFLG